MLLHRNFVGLLDDCEEWIQSHDGHPCAFDSFIIRHFDLERQEGDHFGLLSLD